MPDGTQLDLSQVGQDSGFRSATMPDRIAYLSSIDPDFAKAAPADKAGYINHLLGNDKQTQFEKERDPANQQGFFSALGGGLKKMLTPNAPTPYTALAPGEYGEKALQQQVQEAQQRTQDVQTQDAARKQAGYSPLYRGMVPVAESVGADVTGMEQAADVGNKAGILGRAAAPVAVAAAPMVARETVGALAPKLSGALKSSAAKNYQDVLNPTRVDTKYQTQKIMPQLVKEAPVAMTREGLAEKAAGKADIAGQQIEEQVSQLQGSMETQPVIDGLENLRQKYQVNGVSLRPEVDGAINTLQDQLRGISQPADVPGGAQGPGEASISYQDVVKARRILDQAVAEVGGYQGRPLSDTSMANIRKATANSFREELGNASPDLAAVNAKFHFWNTLSDVLDATNQRKVGQVNALPRVETVIAGAGGLAKSGLSGAAGYGAAMNLLGKAIRSTGWRTVSAATKSGIADALASGKFDRIANLIGKTGQAGAAGFSNQDLFDPATLDQYAQDHRRF